MRRYAVPLVIVGSMVLLVGLVLMWRSITADSADALPASAPVAPAVQPATRGTAQSLPSAPPNARAPLPQVRSRSTDGPAPSSGGSSPPTLEGESGPPGTGLNTKNLNWGLPQMRAQVAANEPKVVECLTQAAAAGDRPTGDATVTFIAAKRGNEIVIEETAVDDDQTTLKSDSLLTCLHATSKAMTFDGLPREADAVFVTRSIKVVNGGLVENKLVKFSYIR